MLNEQSQRLGLSISIVQNIAADGHNVFGYSIHGRVLRTALDDGVRGLVMIEVVDIPFIGQDEYFNMVVSK